MRRIVVAIWGGLVCLLASADIPSPPDWAVAVFPSGAEFRLEIAADPLTRQRGYMFRENVAADEGMIFLFLQRERHGIWMKNCLVALDIIWLSESLDVVDIAHDLQPCPEKGACPTAVPMKTARYVIEVAGGRTRAEDLRVGDRLLILSEPPLP